MKEKSVEQLSSIRHVGILGSTGSIGTQALEVIRAHPKRFQLTVLTAQTNAALLIDQALEFNPKAVFIGDECKYEQIRYALKDRDIDVYCGAQDLNEIVKLPEIDIVLIALVGFSGLQPTLAAIQAGKDIALANKESLVIAGQLMTDLAKKHQVKLIPVDSEHSAIFQCLIGEKNDSIEKIYLTASGGPFRGKDIHFLSSVTKTEALKHPSWVMGAKVTIDSASLMNKGLEVIEAKWLFNLDVSQIEVIVHPQSIVHSLVQFWDGSMKAQLGLPDMKLPIQYALGYPDRVVNNFQRFNFMDYPNLSFEPVDMHTFRNLALAFEALHAGGNMPCIINAANEIAVEEFLKQQINFLQMSDMIEGCMNRMTFVKEPSLEDYLQTDLETRVYAQALIHQF